jgi:hypothetical protein
MIGGNKYEMGSIVIELAIIESDVGIVAQNAQRILEGERGIVDRRQGEARFFPSVQPMAKQVQAEPAESVDASGQFHARGLLTGACRSCLSPSLARSSIRRRNLRASLTSPYPIRSGATLPTSGCWRSYSVFDRYAIVDEILLAEQTEKLTQHYEKMAAQPERKVVPLNG